MMWGRWRLEPIGVSLPPRANADKLSAMLARARQRRPEISETFSPDHLRLAAACRQLEVSVTEARYEAALRGLPAILNNPVLARGKMNEARSEMARGHDVHIVS